MNLNLETLRSIALGTAYVTEEENGFHFHRFTKEQEDLYKTTSFADKTDGTAGVKLCFKTDSRRLYIKTNVKKASSRSFFAFDIFKNSEMLGQITDITNEGIVFSKGSLMPGNVDLPLGIFEGDFDLGEGDKTVTVYFPWSADATIISAGIDDDAILEPIKKEIKMLIFGDSITHGYDAFSPSGAYSAILTDALGADSRNKGIGGEKFRPELALCKEDIDPNIITVAYGTNDWCHHTKDTFEKNCSEFYEAISKNYPNAKIFAITPIWRADCNEATACGHFDDIKNFFIKVAEKLPNVRVIDGKDFVPHNEKYFSDFYLHPNDGGFAYYGKALANEIKKHLNMR
ncbi:MAG: SGNH/GDSL hydrolase family protein [Clostridia bacterium]|nr:SGNH/GDSL hydrolase family protein [Clostridia bacterium]